MLCTRSARAGCSHYPRRLYGPHTPGVIPRPFVDVTGASAAYGFEVEGKRAGWHPGPEAGWCGLGVP